MTAKHYIASVPAILVIAALMGCGDDAESPVSPPKGNAPVLAFQSDTTVAYGDTLRLNASATDPDGDSLAFSMAVLVSLSEIRTGYFARAGMDASTGAFWFLPGPRDVPDRSFQFTVTDETGLTDTSIFKVTAVVRSRAGTMMPDGDRYRRLAAHPTGQPPEGPQGRASSGDSGRKKKSSDAASQNIGSTEILLFVESKSAIQPTQSPPEFP